MNKTLPELAHRWLRQTPENLSELERRVLQSAVDRRPLSENINDSFAGIQGAGDRIADTIARVGGSWTFILSFIAFLVVWIGANWWLLGRDSFDPYPFIFLNLVLSMIAALQAPVIMMSQNRQAARDRIDAAHDYEVNLKAEIEIMALHEKLDELRHSQIVGMQNEIEQMATQLRRLDEWLTSQASHS
ncbi:DUF1003 domain-containing protein [Mesorhizobium sp. M0622]|uniref:DUF1003 domain-containing protein n=1 Tax=unclassified Mesorhizobium TaxID=325217 RepID=UPI00333632A4